MRLLKQLLPFHMLNYSDVEFLRILQYFPWILVLLKLPVLLTTFFLPTLFISTRSVVALGSGTRVQSVVKKKLQ